MNEEFIYDYDHEAVMRKTENSIRLDGYNSGKRDGFEQGIEQGTIKEKIEIAKSMLKDGLDKETISKYTKLSVEELKQLN